MTHSFLFFILQYWRKNWYVLLFYDGSTVQFEVFLFFFFCILFQDQIRTHECNLCRRKWEHVHLIAVSLAIADRVTASCQGKGSCSHIHRYSNTISVLNVKKGMREKEASFFFLFFSFNSAWINHISSLNEMEEVPERFHVYNACSVAFNRSYKRVSKILEYVCHTNISSQQCHTKRE
jgi:hypothetical protein